ncbi:thiamine-phosphate kinase [Pyruvatibacter sp.]|uniref:thiamine-phosphate kinase n=1 Tax=Pyruvatibacter sp. TaxID=1981328 RepID=UPI0032EDF30E
MAVPPDSEFSLIARLFAPLSDAPHGLGLRDDAGFVPASEPGQRTCITKDMIVAGVHFLPDDPPDLIARKLVRVNVSDLVAKGVVPNGCLLAAAFNENRDVAWLDAFAAGLAQDLETYGMVLIGGDTVRTPGPDSFSLTALGHVADGGFVGRNGAGEGDGLYVTGTIGDAGLGLKILRGDLGTVALGRRTPLIERYHLPHPRVAFGAALAGFATAALDVSDGLVADVGHLTQMSGLCARIELERVPLSSSAQRLVKSDPALRLSLLGAGDDYEIVFSAPADAAEAIAAASGASDTPVTRIGHILAGEAGRVDVVDSAGSVIDVPRAGFRHF